MQTTIYLSADNSVFLQLKFDKIEQSLELDKFEVDLSMQSSLKIKDTVEFKKLLHQLSQSFEIPEKSAALENI